MGRPKGLACHDLSVIAKPAGLEFRKVSTGYSITIRTAMNAQASSSVLRERSPKLMSVWP